MMLIFDIDFSLISYVFIDYIKETNCLLIMISELENLVSKFSVILYSLRPGPIISCWTNEVYVTF